jgi:hypothetical protein
VNLRCAGKLSQVVHALHSPSSFPGILDRGDRKLQQ